MLSPRFQWFKETHLQSCNHIETMTFAIYLSGYIEMKTNTHKIWERSHKTVSLVFSSRNYSSKGEKEKKKD